VTAIAAFGIPRLRVDNSAERFFPRGSPAARLDEAERSLFPAGEPLRILVQGPALWTAEGTHWLRGLERALGDLPGTDWLAGPMGVAERLAGGGDLPEPTVARELLESEPLARDAGLLSPDGRAVSLTVVPAPRRAGSPVEMLAAIDALLATAPEGIEAAVWGLAVLDRAFDEEVARTLTRLVPAATLAVLFVLWIAGGSLASTAPVLVVVAAVELATLGAFGLAGGTVDVVTSLLVPLLLVITTSTSIHLQMSFRRGLRAGASARDAAALAARERGWAVLWAGGTTAAAFGSLAISPIAPVASLGIWAAIGIALATLACRYLLPLLLAGGSWGTPGRPTALERRSGSWARRFTADGRGFRASVLVLASIAALAALAALGHLRVESDLSAYLPTDHPLRTSLAEFDRRGLGSTGVDLLVRDPRRPPGSFLDPAELGRLARLAAALRTDPDVASAAGAGDLFAAARGSLITDGRDSDAAAWLTLALMRGDPAWSDALSLLATPDAARVVAMVPFRGMSEGSALLARLERRARAAGFPEARATGPWAALVRSQAALLRTLVVSLSITTAMIACAWVVALRRPRAVVAALAPNLWAVLVLLGAAAALGVPFEAPTVMTASVLLGLAVDDTFHTYGHLRSGAADRPMAELFEELAPGHVTSSLALAAGFAVLGLASMAPIARFGWLMALGTVTALAGDLVLLPALLRRSRRRAD